MAVKKVMKKRPARAGAIADDSDVDIDSTEEEADEEEETEEAEVWEVVTKRLVAPRFQGITKTILSGVDEMTKITFFSNNPELEVCTIDTTDIESEVVTVTVLPHAWATDLAIDIWDSIEVDALDPNTCNPVEDGWACTYPLELN